MMYRTPTEHAANPPTSWTVHKIGRRWELRDRNGGVFCSFPTKRDATKATTSGPYFDLYNKEGYWMSGGHVAGWKPYVATYHGAQVAYGSACQLGDYD